MNEQLFSPDERERHFKIDHGLEHETEEQYIARKGQCINTGQIVWVRRNFDPNVDGGVYGLWKDGREIATVDDEANVNFRVYVRDLDDGATFLDDKDSLIDAVDAAEQYWGLSTD